ncbi:hypothetical protein MAPG_08294 [Magnaporthiopsis poae ATCC 64411]|uniref:DUF6546 domain-containing protein n=1 Tax=Magnaporthiopsis poae (strain ATCC 64411 / 73-15) TaxID=644358 RepID=A0A0C4E6Z4_MAGP6|nr:hypothetical protein MAPG_08294 [Magnaporthiopsis poae ATCC 64411]
MFLQQAGEWAPGHVWPDGIALEIVGDTESTWRAVAREARALNLPNHIHVFYSDESPEWQREVINWRVWDQTLLLAEFDFHFTIGWDFSETGNLQRFPYSHNMWRINHPAQFRKAGVFSSLSVSKKTIRYFRPDVFADILHRLPGVQRFNWTFKARIGRGEHIRLWENQCAEALTRFPIGLKKLSIHQLPTVERDEQEPGRVALGHAMAQLARRLGSFSVTHLIDATHFFSANVLCWETLEILALQSNKISGFELPSAIELLLDQAAMAALKMPKLRDMLLHNLDRSGVAMYRFTLEGGYATFYAECSDTWGLYLSAACRQSWEAVAEKVWHGTGWLGRLRLLLGKHLS